MRKYILFLTIISTIFFLFRAPDIIYASDFPSMLSDQQNQGGTDKDRDKDGLITYEETFKTGIYCRTSKSWLWK